jgi:hypothetical protein
MKAVSVSSPNWAFDGIESTCRQREDWEIAENLFGCKVQVLETRILAEQRPESVWSEMRAQHSLIHWIQTHKLRPGPASRVQNLIHH